MRLIQVADEVRYARMTTEELRATFLLENLFQPGFLDLAYVDLDRVVIGSAVPLVEPLSLEADPVLRADYFAERRELGILNIGGAGVVLVDGSAYDLSHLDALYLGRGTKSISFLSTDPSAPAEYYLLSYPAHTTYPLARVETANSEKVVIGTPDAANLRRITKVIHLEGVQSCQLVMGYTEIGIGSVWNTMPPHTHMRRTEVYFYFGLRPEERVIHLMGPPRETRHIVVANKQVVVSPGWSIHAGVGTSSYTFCWGMGGENQVYNDMDPVAIAELL